MGKDYSYKERAKDRQYNMKLEGTNLIAFEFLRPERESGTELRALNLFNFALRKGFREEREVIGLS